MEPLRRVMGELIEQASLVAGAAEFRSVALRTLRSLVGFESAIFFATPGDDNAPGTYQRQPSGALIYRHYRANFRSYLPDLAKGRRAAARDGAFIDTQVYSFAERQRLPFFREIVSAQGVTGRIVAYPRFRGTATSVIHLCRHGRGSDFAAADLRRMQELLPILALSEMAVRGARREPPAILAALSPRERAVVDKVRYGYSNREIGMLLGTSPNTVRNQLAIVFRKLSVSSRAELAAWAERNGLDLDAD